MGKSAFEMRAHRPTVFIAYKLYELHCAVSPKIRTLGRDLLALSQKDDHVDVRQSSKTQNFSNFQIII